MEAILQYWMQATPDEAEGGFLGRIDQQGRVYPEAPKGSVLNSRILWSFSAAYRLTKKAPYLVFAQRAYRYLALHFIDHIYGGVFWTVDYKGHPLDTKKQVYALAFAVYGLSEYVLATGDEKAGQIAIQLYLDILKHSHDPQHGGYMEALTREWKEIADLRLSAKDANERKSMNTHLHLLEGFANLYRIWPDAQLKEKLRELIRIFLDHLVSPETAHLVLFFSDEWQPRSTLISFGHDIEATWLVQEAAELIGDEALLKEVKKRSAAVANAAAEGLDADGGLWYECEGGTGHWVREKHWWPQAEAMVGFFNAWQNGGGAEQLQRSLNAWAFVKAHLRDKDGEWVWGVKEDHTVMKGEDKAGLWKCPYHNSRACVELIRRIGQLTTAAAAETRVINQSAI